MEADLGRVSVFVRLEQDLDVCQSRRVRVLAPISEVESTSDVHPTAVYMSEQVADIASHLIWDCMALFDSKYLQKSVRFCAAENPNAVSRQ